MKEKWESYIDYLREWANDHESIEFAKMSPSSFEEFIDNEYME